jgi:hypothetical protein
MSFNVFTNVVSAASRRIAGWLVFVGLLLAGFGVLIISYPKFFATLAAIVFFIAGGGFIAAAVKIYMASVRLKKTMQQDSDAYRKNVRIHIEGQSDGDYDDAEGRI